MLSSEMLPIVPFILWGDLVSFEWNCFGIIVLVGMFAEKMLAQIIYFIMLQGFVVKIDKI